ncbi:MULTISPECIES: hypothetical protein [unclassified Pseudomonas]|uniref:hypothetical protein n=1 Tax=unclassified Pseudomonas TaxID=196821 RepID=UPI00257C53D4|nr:MULTISPECIES: hypothetical protein [unclassified Pseudomonas]
MYLIQLLLPLYDNDGHDLPKALFGEVRNELVEKFGGLTAFSQAPAKGLWQEDESHTIRDELIIYEVMADALEQVWWQQYRASLETRFRQETVVVRAHTISLL